MYLLQLGGPGGSSLLSAGVLTLIIGAVLAYYVYTDASKRGKDNALLWALAVGILTLLTLIGGLLALAVYVWKR